MFQICSQSSLESPELMKAKEGYNTAFLFNTTVDEQPPVCKVSFHEILQQGSTVPKVKHTGSISVTIKQKNNLVLNIKMLKLFCFF
jgi:hypothetical protein